MRGQSRLELALHDNMHVAVDSDLVHRARHRPDNVRGSQASPEVCDAFGIHRKKIEMRMADERLEIA